MINGKGGEGAAGYGSKMRQNTFFEIFYLKKVPECTTIYNSNEKKRKFIVLFRWI
jgi:hypothetical protein